MDQLLTMTAVTENRFASGIRLPIRSEDGPARRMNDALQPVIWLAFFLQACAGSPPSGSVSDRVIDQCRQSTQFAGTESAGYYQCIGDARLQQGDREAAMDAYLTYLDREPEDQAIRLQLAELLIEAGRYQAARRHLEQLVTRDASNADAFYLLGETHRLAGHCEPALSAYTAALRRSPGHYSAQQGLVQTKNETCGTRYQSGNKKPVMLHDKPQGGGARLREDQW